MLRFPWLAISPSRENKVSLFFLHTFPMRDAPGGSLVAEVEEQEHYSGAGDARFAMGWQGWRRQQVLSGNTTGS